MPDSIAKRRVFRPGDGPSLAPFAELLGLDRAGGRVGLQSVACEGERIELTAGGQGGALTLEIVPERPGTPGLVATGQVVLRYRGRGAPGAFAQALARAFRARIGSATFRDLLALLPAETAEAPAPAETAAPGSPPPAEVPAGLAGQVRAGGAASQRRLAALLGLDGEPARPHSAAWEEDRAVLALALEGGGVAQFEIGAADGSPGLLVAGELLVRHSGDEPPPALVDRVKRHAPARLAGLSPGALAQAFAQDPELGAAHLPLPPATAARHRNVPTEPPPPPPPPDPVPGPAPEADYDKPRVDAPERVHQLRLDLFIKRRDHSQGWWKFVFPGEETSEDIRFGERTVRVQHGTRECLGAFHAGDKLQPLHLFSDVRPFNLAGGAETVETRVDAADVLGGRTQARLGEAMLDAARRLRPQLLWVHMTCLPTLVGDDARPFIRQLEQEQPELPVGWTSIVRGTEATLRPLVAKALAGVAHRPEPGAVVLGGLGEGAETRALGGLLERLGLRVLGTLFPVVDPARVELLARAQALVWARPVRWLDATAFPPGLQVISPPQPYGLAGTRAWLETVGTALGVDPGPAAARLEEELRPELDEARAACAGVVAALAGDPFDLGLLTSGRPWPGFPIATLLRELGVRVRLLVHGDPGDAPAAEPDGSALPKPEPYRSPAELDALLADGTDLAFTHFNHDPRLDRRCVAGFSQATFVPGPAGLAESGRRLAAKARRRVAPRYRRFFTRP